MMTLIFAVVMVLIASALCSGTEAALFSVPLVRARFLAQSRTPAALALLSICEHMARPIATVVILNNMANIPGSIIVGAIAARVLGDPWMGLFSGVLTFLVIIFAEIIPKTLGERYAEQIALTAALPIKGLTFAFTPIIWVLERILAPITTNHSGPTINEAEIKLMARIGVKEGAIEAKESEIIQRVFDLGSVTASDLMTPRVAVTYLDGSRTLNQARDEIMNSQHSRILVSQGTRDQVTGLVMKHELLSAIVRGEGERSVADLQQRVRFVPEARKAVGLLEDFLKSRQHLAVVMDEFGGVAGVVTLEDVLEVLTGEIVDETDLAVNLQEFARRRLAHIRPPKPKP